MDNLKQEKLSIFHGPNRFADFACVVLEFETNTLLTSNQSHKDISNKATQDQLNDLRSFFPDTPHFSKISHLNDYSVTELIAEIAKFVQTEQFDLNFKSRTSVINNRCYIALSYFSSRAAQQALQFSYNLVRFVIRKENLSKHWFMDRIKTVLHEQKILQPDQTQTMMLNAALDLKIPVYHYQDSNQYVCYGQGCHSIVYHSASSEFDSSIGVTLQQDKFATNRLIKIMGFPATDQILVKNLEEAKRAAKLLKFPLAVKPVGQGQGFGVSCNITSDLELESAFANAAKYRSYAVLIEKHVEGYDLRLTVANKKLIGANCRIPAKIIGDGCSSIAQLIEMENSQRSEILKRQGLMKDIKVDDNLKQMLKKLSYDLESIPSKDEIIYLRSNANVSTGGTFTEVIEKIHPDFAQMAIEISNYFRLDVIGIDFITKDFTKSWKEQGAVIEVNSTPAYIFGYSQIHLQDRFHKKNMGRITTKLWVNIDDNKIETSNHLKASGMAYVSVDKLIINGLERQSKNKTLFEKCLAAVTDPTCKELCVSASESELKENGLPLDYFSQCYVAQENEFSGWLKQFCGVVEVLSN